MYGIIGRGYAPKSVIEASLNDLGIKEHFVIPWYGKVTPGLEIIYDWMIDNEIKFSIVAQDDTKAPPRVLLEAAYDTPISTTDVERGVIAVNALNNGHILVMWDEEWESESVRIASIAIDQKLPTLELTNGMVPIIFDVADPDGGCVGDLPAATGDLEIEIETDGEDMSFDRPVLENMPAAVVKRMAKEKGFDSKNKEDAINSLLGETPAPAPTSEYIQEERATSIAIHLTNGNTITIQADDRTLNDIWMMVAMRGE